MKHLYFLLLSLIFIFSACTTTSKICISGTPGTIIKEQSGEILGTIDSSSRLITKVEKTSCQPIIFLSKEPNSDKWIPFALDFKRDNSNLAISFMLYDIGMASIIATFPLLITANIAAVPTLLGGALLGFPAAFSIGNHQGCYDYSKMQTTNNDLFSTEQTMLSNDSK